MSTEPTKAEPAAQPQPPAPAASPPAVTIDQAMLQKAIEAAQSKKPPMGATIAAALAKVQGALQSVGKDRDVEVKTEKGRYAFKYATLAAIWDVIRTPCAENGLAIVQFPTVDLEKRQVSVETQIMHTSGERIVNLCVLPCMRPDPQGIGAIITYARRYSLSALLGVTSDDENEEEILSRQRDEYSFGPPPTSSQRPPAPKVPPPASKASPPKANGKAAPATEGEQLSEADLEQQMKSCTSAAELSKVAAKVKSSGFQGEARARLLSVYQTSAAELAKGGVK